MANPTLLSMPLCVNADKNTIPPTDAGTSGLFSEELGFQDINSLPLASGGKAPNRRDFNGVFALLGGIAYACQRGYTFEWDATQDYVVGCVVLDTNDNKRYECIADVTANATPPSSDTTHWQEFRTGGGGVPIGTIEPFAGNGQIPEGYLLCDGSAVSRSMFPDLFEAIGTTYGSGDGSTTFNLPDYSDGKFFEGSTTAGVAKSAGLPNIKGQVSDMYGADGVPASRSGALKDTNIVSSPYNPSSGHVFGPVLIDFNASNSNSIYSDSVTTVQPYSMTCRVLIKAFDGQTPDSALIDITQYANELAGKADRSLSNLTQAGEAKLASSIYTEGFTIIYPNGGTEANPATVTTSSKYLENNPFPGYYVNCVAECLYNNEWYPAPFESLWNSNSNRGYGTAVAQVKDSQIEVLTGSFCVCRAESNLDGGFAPVELTSAPCRVKVWKIGKIPT
jgi:hypothetical protein